MYKLILFSLLVSCGVKHKLEGDPEVRIQNSEHKVNVVHSIDPETLKAIEELCQGRDTTDEEVQSCIENLIQLFEAGSDV